MAEKLWEVKTAGTDAVASRQFKEFLVGHCGCKTLEEAFATVGGNDATSQITADDFVNAMRGLGTDDSAEEMERLFSALCGRAPIEDGGQTEPAQGKAASEEAVLTRKAFMSLFDDSSLIRDLLEQVKGKMRHSFVAFERIDHASMGYFAEEPFKKFLADELGYTCEGLMKRLFELADLDGDGVVSRSEFKLLWGMIVPEAVAAQHALPTCTKSPSSLSWISKTEQSPGRGIRLDVPDSHPLRSGEVHRRSVAAGGHGACDSFQLKVDDDVSTSASTFGRAFARRYGHVLHRGGSAGSAEPSDSDQSEKRSA